MSDSLESIHGHRSNAERVLSEEEHNCLYSPDTQERQQLSVFKQNQFECGLMSNYVGKQYIDNSSDDARSIPDYFINNLSVQYSLKLKNLKSIDFRVLVNNIFDVKYVSNGYVWYTYYLDGNRENDLRFFPQAGINFLAGITFKF